MLRKIKSTKLLKKEKNTIFPFRLVDICWWFHITSDPFHAAKHFVARGKHVWCQYVTAKNVIHLYFWQSEIKFRKKPQHCSIVLYPGNILPAKPSGFSWNESSFRSHLPPHIRNQQQSFPNGIGGDKDNAWIFVFRNSLFINYVSLCKEQSELLYTNIMNSISPFHVSSPDEIICGHQWLLVFFGSTVHSSNQLDIPGIWFSKPANIWFICGWVDMMGNNKEIWSLGIFNPSV